MISSSMPKRTRIPSLPSRIQMMQANRIPQAPRPQRDGTAQRKTGRALQERRRRVWARNPHCAVCGELTDLDSRAARAFELDHIVALVNGGEDTEANTQVLCLRCHEDKTRRDLGQRLKVQIGADGWPIDG